MSVLPCTFLLLVLLCLPELPVAKRQANEEKPDKPLQAPLSPPPAKRGRSRSVPASGELSTKDGHRCTWQTAGEALVSLMVNCSAEAPGGPQRYWCRYAGKPDLCQAYGLKSSQYWKQLVGKLKKRQNACEGEKVLKAKTCKKAPAEAHMKLARRGNDQDQEDQEEEGRKAGKKRGQAAAKTERKKKKGEEEEKKKKREERTEEEEEEGEEMLQGDMEPLQSYCSEGWHAVCSFFLKFFEG